MMSTPRAFSSVVPSPGASWICSGRRRTSGTWPSRPGNRLEKLKGRLAGFHSIRVNDQFRIVFKFEAGRASHVQIVDYH